ncbi:hypothetical protein BV25DRAFT_1794759, partial [Artomyces pyxidatus]
ERARLDARLHELRNEIQSVQLQRNAIAPISFLPNELLFRIILYHAYSVDIFSASWVKAMLVCRRWYEVARSHAQLWSYVSDSVRRQSPSHVWEMLKRSGDYPLTCTFSPMDEEVYVLEMILKKHMHRVRSLKINGDAKLFSPLLKEGDRWPILEHLALDSWGSENTHLSPSLFEHGAPRLRSLELNNIGMSGWHYLSNLTNLSLVRGHDGTTPHPSFDVLLATLQRSPSLRRLKLHGYLPSDEEGLMALDRLSTQPFPIDLPLLEHLDVVAAFEAIDALLRCVILPPTASMYLIARGIFEGWGVTSLLVPIHRHLHQSGSPVLLSLSINSYPDSYTSITADSTPTTESDLFPNDYRPHFRLVVHPTKQSACRSVFTKVLNALPLDNAEHANLTLVWGHGLSTTTWRKVFRHLPRLKVVRIGVNEGMVAVLEGITDAVKHGTQGLWGAQRRRAARGLFAWPTHLSLVASNDGGTGVPDPVAQTHYYDSLVRLLSEYRDMDAPLKPAGVCWPTLEIDSIRHGYVMGHDYRHALFPLVQDLIIYGKSWDPVSERKRMRESRRKMRELRKEFGIPQPEDEGSSSEGSDSAEDPAQI